MIAQQLQKFWGLNYTRPFKWGRWDCANLVREWGEFINGKKYSIRGYNRFSARFIDSSIEVDKELKRTNKERIGDIVLFELPKNRKALGIWNGTNIIAIDYGGMIAGTYPILKRWSIN